MVYKFFDVSSKLEIPPEPKGYRYFDCIGGTKEKRYYVAPEEIPRGYFLENNEDILDECLIPIYKNRGICVRQDPSFPIPGFYIISPTHSCSALDQMSIILNTRLFFILYYIRKGIRQELSIDFINIYYEEKPKRSCNVHFILLPIYLVPYPRLYDIDLNAYLSKYEFSYKEYKNQILEYNFKMRQYLDKVGLQKLDDTFENGMIQALQG